MKITAITCTGGRPEAFALCERYAARQTLKADQVLVLDDGVEPTTPTMGQDYHYWPDLRGRGSLVGKIRRAIERELIKGDIVIFQEDDDIYAADWFAWCAEQLETLDLVGEGRALYYNVKGRHFFEHTNLQHASLCQTAIHRRVFPELLRECSNSQCPFLDVRIWKAIRQNRQVFDPYRSPNKRRVVGIKGMPGRTGYGGGHTGRDRSAADDLRLVKLRSLIGDDADAYAPFYDPLYAAANTKIERNMFTTPPEPTPRIGAREWHKAFLAKNGQNPKPYG